MPVLHRSVITPPKRWAPVRLGEVWSFRDLVVQLVLRDLRLRYKQTALGASWVVLQPLLAAGVFGFVFGRIAGFSGGRAPYFVFAFVGLTMWTAFSTTVTRLSISLTANSALISKVFFPRLVLPLSAVGSTIVDVCVTAVLGVVVLAVGGVAPGVAALTTPLWFALGLAMATGIGLIAAALMVQYRDIGYALPTALQLLLYASPVAYSISEAPEDIRRWLELNPVAGLMQGIRWALLDAEAPTAVHLIATIGGTVVALAIGLVTFGRMEQRFADVI
jgi:lipopolysaccharide transport system permease protein